MNPKVIGLNFFLVLYFKDFPSFFFQLKHFPKDLPEQKNFNKKPFLKKKKNSNKGDFFSFLF